MAVKANREGNADKLPEEPSKEETEIPPSNTQLSSPSGGGAANNQLQTSSSNICASEVRTSYLVTLRSVPHLAEVDEDGTTNKTPSPTTSAYLGKSDYAVGEKRDIIKILSVTTSQMKESPIENGQRGTAELPDQERIPGFIAHSPMTASDPATETCSCCLEVRVQCIVTQEWGRPARTDVDVRRQSSTVFPDFDGCAEGLKASPLRRRLEVGIRKLFNARLDQSSLEASWKAAAMPIRDSRGLRLLHYDWLECLFSFLCSTNNNVKRISSMVRELTAFGVPLDNIGSHRFFAFPLPDQLVGQEERLRSLRFGYRAKFIDATARALLESAKFSPHRLRSLHPDDLTATLRHLPGIGYKVADCISLMGFGHFSAVPVDVHIQRIAAEILELSPAKKASKGPLSLKEYQRIQCGFRQMFGTEFAGVAQLLLYKEALDSRRKKESHIADEADGLDFPRKMTKRDLTKVAGRRRSTHRW